MADEMLYRDFLKRKKHSAGSHGFDPVWMPDTAFDFQEYIIEKAVRKGRADVAVIGMRVDARTRAAGELERFFATFELPVLTYLRDTQVYVQATGAGMTIFDLPRSRAERDLEQWQAIIDWVESGDRAEF